MKTEEALIDIQDVTKVYVMGEVEVHALRGVSMQVYPGEMLSGAMIVGPGLPRVSLERELMREYYQDKYDEGFNYAYLYPGINRVVQSAGRVIRGDADRGVIVLVGQRFARYAYASNFPDQWREGRGRARLSQDLAQDLADFWEESTGRPRTPYL